MNTEIAITGEKKSILGYMADRYGMETEAFEKTLRATVIKEASREQFAAFLLVAKEHNLNPITKEIHAFPTKGGGVQPVVGVDGWMTIINNHPQMDGMEFKDIFDKDDKLQSVSCKIYRKDRAHPTEVTEYMSECQRNSEPWKKWPNRMLRHKAAIQAARYAFGLSGIVDLDEFERGETIIDITPKESTTPPPVPKDTPVPVADGDIIVESKAEEVKEEEIIDPDKFLDALESELKDINDLAGLKKIKDDYKKIRPKLFPPDAIAADTIIKSREGSGFKK